MNFFSALLLGLLASVHCAGMCAGLQTALQHTHVIRSPRQMHTHALVLNLGRILVYCLAGAVFSAFGASLGSTLTMVDWSQALRGASAVILILIGTHLLLSNLRPLLFLEKPAYALWRRLQPWMHGKNNNQYRQSLRRGVVWAFLPCGLVYSLLLAATVSGSAVDGTLIMAGFGLGTLPAMLLTGTAFTACKHWLQSRYSQQAGGLFFLLSGTALLAAPVLVNHSAIKAHPLFYNLARCFV